MTVRIDRQSGQDAFVAMYPYICNMPLRDHMVMRQAFDNSVVVWIGYQDDQVLCAWGLAPPTLCSDHAYLWLFTTEHLTEHVFTFVRHSQRAVAEMLATYPTIHGHCVVGADKSIRWMRWLGAVFQATQGGLLPFTIEAHRG